MKRLAGVGRGAAYGAVGAAAVGLLEVLAVIVDSRLDPGPIAIAALLGLALAATAIPGAVAGALLWPLHRSPVAAGLAGALAVGSSELFVTWFSGPAPFQPSWPMQGNVVVFLAILLGGFAAVVGIARVRALRVGVPVALGVGAVALLVVGHPASKPAVHGPANVLLVTLDTTRADRFGAYPIDTAATDRIAAEGASFEAAYANVPVTGPSHASLMLGCGPWDHGLLLNGRPLPLDRKTLAEALSAHGYATGAFVSAYVLDGALGFSRGFDTYDDDFHWVTGLSRILPGRLVEMHRRSLSEEDALLRRRGGDTVDRALRWLDRQDGAWFAWVHLFDAHGPYDRPPPFDERYYHGTDPRDPNNHSMDQVGPVPGYLGSHLRGITDVDWVVAQYDGGVAYEDAQVARLLAWLDDHNEAADTLVVVVGDHGEGLGAHGEWFTHGDHLYEDDLHVPLAMRFPGRIAAGMVVRQPVEVDDVAPTVLDELGVEKPASETGFDWRAAIEGGAAPRTFARAEAYDREANKAARALDPRFPPTWRLASIRTADAQLVLHESGHREEVLQGAPDDAARAAADAVIAARARDPGVDAVERALLQGLGYLEDDSDVGRKK